MVARMIATAQMMSSIIDVLLFVIIRGCLFHCGDCIRLGERPHRENYAFSYVFERARRAYVALRTGPSGPLRLVFTPHNTRYITRFTWWPVICSDSASRGRISPFQSPQETTQGPIIGSWR